MPRNGIGVMAVACRLSFEVGPFVVAHPWGLVAELAAGSSGSERVGRLGAFPRLAGDFRSLPSLRAVVMDEASPESLLGFFCNLDGIGMGSGGTEAPFGGLRPV